MVLEYVEELENLYDIVGKNGPLKEPQCRKIFKMLIESIYTMHKNGLCHR
jgi:serine/threonine protein kinase